MQVLATLALTSVFTLTAALFARVSKASRLMDISRLVYVHATVSNFDFLLTALQRGGAGNIGKSPHLGPVDGASPRHSQEYIPENALREQQEDFHTGRGGAGNVHKEKYGGHTHSPDRKGLGDKIKEKLHLDGKKEHKESPLANETRNTE
jgi:hypothetical protein